METVGPQIGTQVHYVSYGTPGGEFTSLCRAATVSEVQVTPEEPGGEHAIPNVIGVVVLNPTGLFFHPLAAGGCGHSAAHEGGTWHWPGEGHLATDPGRWLYRR